MMRLNSELSLGLALALGLGAAACGDDGNGGGGGSGISGSLKISELSEAQAIALCKEAANGSFGQGIKAGLCTFQGIIEEQISGGNCEEARDACMKEPITDCEADVKEGDFVSDCDVTVGEYRKCMDDYGAVYQEVAKDITCDTDWEELQSGEEDPEPPASCKAIEQKCPGVFDDTDSDADFSVRVRRLALRSR